MSTAILNQRLRHSFESMLGERKQLDKKVSLRFRKLVIALSKGDSMEKRAHALIDAFRAMNGLLITSGQPRDWLKKEFRAIAPTLLRWSRHTSWSKIRMDNYSGENTNSIIDFAYKLLATS